VVGVDAPADPAPVRVGLVGAGPWAQVFQAPMLASSPHTELVAVWARRPEAADSLARAHGATAVSRFADLLSEVEAVAFSVPPDVQAQMATEAARAGRHLLLEKPLGLTVADATGVAEAATASGVVTQMVLTWRYLPFVRDFLAGAAGFDTAGARAASISGWSRDGALFATPWRLEHGALLDVGPHVLDLLDAAVGPLVDVTATGDPLRWVEVTGRHESGAISQASLSITTPVEPAIWSCELYGPTGSLVLRPPDDDELARQYAAATQAVAAELAQCIRAGEPHPLDAARGLRLQRLLERAHP
jgi:predicted dehydrogenase